MLGQRPDPMDPFPRKTEEDNRFGSPERQKYVRQTQWRNNSAAERKWGFRSGWECAHIARRLRIASREMDKRSDRRSRCLRKGPPPYASIEPPGPLGFPGRNGSKRDDGQTSPCLW